MKIAYFDCQFGAAGDMLLAALLGAGLPESAWLGEIKKIALPEGSFTVSINQVVRGTIASQKVDVQCAPSEDERNLSEIEAIISRSPISENARRLARQIFGLLATAEARIHGVATSAVHFHEVGAIDAIVDIVGFAIGYDLLGIERSEVSAVPLGSGTTSTEHGIFPVPPPAVLSLLTEAQAPTRASDIDYECLTPTGAAILATVAARWGPCPAMDRIVGIGYGAGTKESDRWPNVCRIIIGERAGQATAPVLPARFAAEAIAVVEANLDDFSPQALSWAVERLSQSGALDVSVLPAVMKKGRSGHLLSVLCKPDDRVRIEELILTETSSIGVRSHLAERLVAEREWRTVTLSSGDQVRVKIARDRQGCVVNTQPEYEDCAACAAARGIPLKEVIWEAMAAARSLSATASKLKEPGK